MTTHYFRDGRHTEIRMTKDEAACIVAAIGQAASNGNLYGVLMQDLHGKLCRTPGIRSKFLDMMRFIDTSTVLHFVEKEQSKAPECLQSDAVVIDDDNNVELDLSFEEALVLRVIVGCCNSTGICPVCIVAGRLFDQLSDISDINDLVQDFREKELTDSRVIRVTHEPKE